MAKVSVVIPSYNYGHFLGEAIHSVRAQTYRDFEIIVVDDGSTDATREVVTQFPEVKYLHQTNQGIAAARNAGLVASQGEFLVFLDADDWLLPNALAAGVNCLNEHPECAFVSGHQEMVSILKQPLATPPIVCIARDHYRALLDYNYICTAGQVMFRRAVLVSEGGFSADVPGCDDAEIYLRLTRNYPVYCHDQMVIQHRVHDSSTSRNRALMLGSMKRVYQQQLAYVEGNAELENLCRQGIELCRRFLTKEAQRQRRERLKSNRLVRSVLGVRHRIRAALIFRRYKLQHRSQQ